MVRAERGGGGFWLFWFWCFGRVAMNERYDMNFGMTGVRSSLMITRGFMGRWLSSFLL